MPQFPQANPLASLQSLLRLKSPTNMATARPQRELNVLTGADQELPDGESPELKIAQEGLAQQTGMGFSREALQGDILARLRRAAGAEATQHAYKMDELTVPEQIKGAYGVRQAEASGKAGADRAQMNQDAIASRTQMQIDAANGRQQAGFGQANAAREDQQAFHAGSAPTAGLSAIARERQALAAAVAKAEPGMLGKMFRQGNPRQAELENFDNSLAYAQKIVHDYPQASAEEALGAMGATNYSPEELGQVQKFLLLLRGH